MSRTKGSLTLPSREAMAEFLVTEACRPDGSVLSWVSQTRPGHAYPEAAGFVLALLSATDGAGRHQRRTAAWLATQVSAGGAVGRHGIEYLFDTGMALAGLIEFRNAGGEPARGTLQPMLDFIERAITAHSAVGRAPEGLEPRWSTCFGAHLLKLAVVLQAVDDRRSQALAARLAETLLPLYDDGRFRLHADSERSYAHASCYAAEGLMALAGGPRHPTAETMLGRSAAWLAGVQAQDGGIPAWPDAVATCGQRHADATAQAVRIWVHVDAERFRPSIDRALGFLARLQHASGGILYHEDSDCRNTWATVFTIQAVDWARAGRPTGPVI